MAIRRKRVAKVAAIALAAFVSVMAVGLVVVESNWFKQWLRRYVVTRAEQVVDGRLSIGALGGSLFTGVTLDGVTLLQNGTPVLAADRIVIRYDPFTLMKGDIAFSSVRLERVTANVVQGADGWNVEHLLKPVDPSARRAPRQVSFERIELIDSLVSVMPSSGASRRLSDTDAELSLTLNANGLQMKVTQLSANDEASGLRISRLQADTVNTFSRVKAFFAAESPTARLSGRVDGDAGNGQRHFTGDVEAAHLDLSRLLLDSRFGSDINGHATFDATVPGDNHEHVVRLEFAGPFVRAFGYEAADIRTSGLLANGRLALQFATTAYSARVAGTAVWVMSPGAAATGAGLTASGEFDHLDMRRLPSSLALPRLVSDVSGHFAVHTGANAWGGDVTLRRSRVAGAQLAPGLVAHLDARGSDLRYSARGRVAGLVLARLAAPLKLPILAERRFAGAINGTFDVTGREPGRGPRSLVIDATLAKSIVGGTRIESMAALTSLTGNRLTLETKGYFSGLSGSTLGLAPSNALAITGIVDGGFVLPDIRRTVAIDTIDAHARLELGSSSIYGLVIDDGGLDVVLSRGVLQVNALNGVGPEGRFDGHGTIALGEEGQSAFDVVVTSDDIGPILARFGRKATGAARLEGKITGSPDQMTATGLLTSTALTVDDRFSALTTSTTFTADVVDRQFAESRVHAQTEGNFVKIAGTEVVKLTMATDYHARSVDVEARLEEPKRSMEVAGVVAFAPEEQTVRLRRLALSTEGEAWTLPEGREAEVHYGNGLVRVANLSVVHGSERLSAAGTFAIEPGRVTSDNALVVSLTNVDVAEANRLLLGTRKIGGRINAVAEIRGSSSNPDVTANLSVTGGFVEDAKFDVVEGRVALKDHVATTDLRIDESAENHVTVAGSIPLTADAHTPLALDVKSTAFNLGFLQGLTTEVEKVTGTGAIDLQVTGSLSQPRVNGSVNVANGQFQVPSMGVLYRDLQARASVVDNRLTLEEFHVSDDDKHVFTAHGGLDLASSARAVDVTLTAQDFQIVRNDFGNMSVDADLTLSGDLANPRVAGRVRLDSGRVEMSEVLGRATKDPYRTSPEAIEAVAQQVAAGQVDGAAVAAADKPTPAAAPPPPSLSPLDRALIDVELVLPDNLVLRGRNMHVAATSLGIGDMNMTVGGRLNLRKDPASDFVLVGAVEVVRGYYSFQGRRFDVTRGSDVKFRGERPIDPALAISATREVSGVTAMVDLTGTAREPAIALSSTPPLDPADVLAVIVFNQPINQLNETEVGSLTARAGQMAAGAVTAPIADSVGRALNLDQFEIMAAGPNGSGPAVQLGSQIGTRVFVGIKQEFSRGDMSTLSFEYRFSKFLRLVTSVAQSTQGRFRPERTAGTAADFLFVIRY